MGFFRGPCEGLKNPARLEQFAEELRVAAGGPDRFEQGIECRLIFLGGKRVQGASEREMLDLAGAGDLVGISGKECERAFGVPLVFGEVKRDASNRMPERELVPEPAFEAVWVRADFCLGGVLEAGPEIRKCGGLEVLGSGKRRGAVEKLLNRSGFRTRADGAVLAEGREKSARPETDPCEGGICGRFSCGELENCSGSVGAVGEGGRTGRIGSLEASVRGAVQGLVRHGGRQRGEVSFLGATSWWRAWTVVAILSSTDSAQPALAS